MRRFSRGSSLLWDAAERGRWPPEFTARALSATGRFREGTPQYEHSQMSGVDTRRFCREQGLAVSTFGLWRRKFTGETFQRVRWP